MKSVVSEKGQVTIPSALRKRMGITPGVVLDFEEVNGQLVATKSNVQDNVSAIYGVISLGMPTDSFIAEARDSEE